MHCTLVVFSFEHDFNWALSFHSAANLHHHFRLLATLYIVWILVSLLALNSPTLPLKLFVTGTLILWISVDMSTFPFLCIVSFSVATCSHRLSIFLFLVFCLSLQGVPSCQGPHATLVLFMTQWCWSISVLVVTQVHTQSILADCKVYGHGFKRLAWPTFVRYRVCSKIK